MASLSRNHSLDLYLPKSLGPYQTTRSRNLKLNLEKSLDEVYCEHCHDEFEDQNSIMITSTLVLYVKRLSKNNQHNHIQYDHQELYCYNHDKFISHNCQI